ncbi:hypothetical protein [Bradyrhizobium sp. 76]|jgi:hypothetical protein|uniref:hypothetical protein n=1 Tax=Bradyrhizobium sp. 76 TaxID=2782680 RepID=UPI001FFA63D6|nr:hypothetical protein [Bradyrhizobium sp. 76]MCK1406005.1 hypothetical protein [Bradyrhizobium sp. 76]
MPSAIAMIVAAYVKIKDRRSLEDLLSRRRKSMGDLKTITGINPDLASEALQYDIEVIEAGLEQLKPPPGELPQGRR